MSDSDVNSTALLAHCPFCGKAGETQIIEDTDSRFFPQCTGCSSCDVWFFGEDSESQWNHRAQRAEGIVYDSRDLIDNPIPMKQARVYAKAAGVKVGRMVGV